jgi:UDP-N-acetylmuramyl pentapeptide phosphotransferase/UDP-N-acetylglucosamine-1-phosphate transferase
MSGWNAITGVRGLVVPFLMSVLVQFGVVSLTVGLLLCAAASATGVALFWWAARRGRAEASTATGDAGATR